MPLVRWVLFPAEKPQLESQAALMVDASSGAVLFEKKISSSCRLPP
jgi:D-alanyl-D-alanine carboxypeptidase